MRNSNDVVDVIGEYVTLKKSGHGFSGLCPFHNEKTPSFHVHTVKQIFHCFGCHKGGNVITFIMEIEGLNFPEAVERLAKRSGITLEHTVGSKPFQKATASPNDERLVSALEWAAKYFHYLLHEGKEYEFARKYVVARGLSEKTVKKFRIGVAPKGWNTLLGLMTRRGFKVSELIQAGLVVQKDNPEGGYDRFRERLMFPICDKEGRTIGFGARILGNEPNQPKYLNSTDSPLFSKRRNLYGLYENQRGIRLKEEVVVVEGYMDVVGLFEKGVDNAVATMGTALTEEHCSTLRGFTRRIVTVFDPDDAGTEASRRSVPLFLAAGLFAKDLVLPEGKDPDEYALKFGADAFYELCRLAPRQVTKLLKDIAGRGALTEEETAKVLEDLTPILRASRRLPDRALLWDNISLVLKVSQASLRELSEAGSPVDKNRLAPQQNAPSARKPAAKKVPSLSPLEKEFFLASIRAPESFLSTPAERWVGGLANAEIIEALSCVHRQKSVVDAQKEMGEWVHRLHDPELLSALTEASLQEKPPIGATGAFISLLERLEKKKKELEIQALSAQVRLNQTLGNVAEQLRLLERLNELRSSG